MTQIPDGLRARYEEGRLIPFIGSGVARSVVWANGAKRGVSWRELVDEAARKVGVPEPDLLRVRGTDLQILEYYKIKNHLEVAPLRSWFEREMSPSDSDLEANPILSELAGLENCKLIYTTNYDDFIERRYALSGKDVVVLSIEANIASALRTQRIKSETVSVIKFHGDLANPSRMVLSEDDYAKRMTFADMEDQRLKSDMLGKAALFIGYSFSDFNVSYLFRTLNERFQSLPESLDGRRAYIILADPSDFEYELFRSRNIEVVPVRGTHITESTAAILREVRT